MGASTDTPQTDDRPQVIELRDLPAVLGRSRSAVYRWRDDGKIPPPDQAPTRKALAWKRSTLEAAGLLLRR